MNRLTIRTMKKLAAVIICGSVLASCKKVFDVEPQSVVDKTQMYRNVYDADAAVIGVYGKVMNLAKTYVLLNELRADLMDVTFNADQDLKALSTHSAVAGNPYINPQPFYEVILNCNDVLKNFTIMYSESKLKEDEYRQRYSDVASVRTWVYLQLGIHYGRIPYVTDPLAQVSDLKDNSKFPMIELDPLIDTLLAFMEKLPSKDDYPVGTTLQTTVDGYNTQKFFINKNILLGDLYLWDGQYKKAATTYRKVMDINGPAGQNEQFYNQYKVSSFNEAGISYTRANDVTSLVYTPGWRYLFERGQDNFYNYEWIWVLPFDKRYQPQNPFVDIFSISGGRYLVKPSQQAMDNWNSQTQVNLFPFDARGTFTYRNIGGQPVIMKYLYNYLDLASGLPVDILSKQGKWFLNRATTLHLHFAEAANRDGMYRVAYALVNNGIRVAYDPNPTGGNNRDVTNIQNTLDLPDPYKFDARQGDAPPYRNPWYRNQGIRSRANLQPVVLPVTDSVNNVENMIINEDGLELAYEGNRWSDLLRVAIRRNDPNFLADKVYNKLLKSGVFAGMASQVRSKLAAKDWFLPFKWQ
jgi:hypothetical protein